MTLIIINTILCLASFMIMVFIIYKIKQLYDGYFQAIEHDINLLWNEVEALEYGGEDNIPEELQV